MQEETNNALNIAEEQLCKTEEFILLSAEHIEDSLKKLDAYWVLQEYQQSPSYSDVPSVSEKKSAFNENLDAVQGKLIYPVKGFLSSFLNNYPSDERALSLFERVKNCEEEVKKIRNVIQRF